MGTFIISYPRSGNTAFRYLIELMTKRPTNGVCGEVNPRDVLQSPVLRSGNDFVANKRHDFIGVQPTDFVFYIIRNPIEAVIRHNEKPRGLAMDKMYRYIDSWMELLQQYDDFEGNKMLIYYDELVQIGKDESKTLYPDAQSKSLNHHRGKIGEENAQKLEAYIRAEHSDLNQKYIEGRI